jgi:hypothetical protein
MTPQERELVAELFDRLASLESAPRDPEAEQVIAEGLRRAPHALYPLVQTVLLQDEALKAADARIRELQAAAGGQPAQGAGTGFLGTMRDSLFGPRAGSVPQVRPAEASGFRGAATSPTPQPQAMQAMQPVPQSTFGTGMFGGGSSFLGTAAAAAAGMIGGGLLLGGIRSMMGGHHSAGAFDQLGGSQYGAGSFGDASPWTGGGSSDLAREAGIDDIGKGSSAGLGDRDSGDRAGLFDTASSDPGDGDQDFDGGFDGSGGDSDTV